MTNLKEDAVAFASTTPANATGSGGVEGMGVGPHGEPGVDLKKKKKLRDITLMKTPIKRLVPNDKNK